MRLDLERYILQLADQARQMREEVDKWKEATKPKVVSYKRKEIPAVVLEKWLNEKN